MSQLEIIEFAISQTEKAMTMDGYDRDRILKHFNEERDRILKQMKGKKDV